MNQSSKLVNKDFHSCFVEMAVVFDTSFTEEEQVKISKVLGIQNMDISLEKIRKRNEQLGELEYFGLIEEAFSQTILLKSSLKTQLESYMNGFKISPKNDVSKSWLIGQIQELMQLEANIFFEYAAKGFKRIYLHLENEKEQRYLHFVYVGVKGVKAGLISRLFGTEFSTEHAKFEFIQFQAVLRKDFLDPLVCSQLIEDP